MKKYLTINVFLLLLWAVFVGFGNKNKKILVVSYNVENLMDTLDEPIKLDDEFTPFSPKNWNSERYNKKLNDIAFVLYKIDTTQLPDIIALIEVENRRVVEDLIKTKYLSSKNYGICHFETNDLRGIDVALLYNKDLFVELKSVQIPLISTETDLSELRQILYVELLSNKDTLHIFVNHWKSRSGGQEKTEIMRIETAKILRKTCDSILNLNRKANIVILGDFNDTPEDKSLSEILNASLDSVFANHLELFNLTAFGAKKGKGSHFHNGKWTMIDNIIVSQSLLDKKNPVRAITNARSFGEKKVNLFYQTKIDQYIPNRTYGGNNYYGGVSDHLPVYFYMLLK